MRLKKKKMPSGNKSIKQKNWIIKLNLSLLDTKTFKDNELKYQYPFVIIYQYKYNNLIFKLNHCTVYNRTWYV